MNNGTFSNPEEQENELLEGIRCRPSDDDVEDSMLDDGDTPTYSLLSSEEIEMMDKFVKQVVMLAKENPVDKAHIAQFWKYLSDGIYKSRYEFVQGKVEVENQKTDLEHKLVELDPVSNKYMTTLRQIGDAVTSRRVLKDMSEYLQVACSNLRTIGNFVDGMTKRQYTPRSKKYSDNAESSNATAQQSKTTIKMDTIANALTEQPSHIYRQPKRISSKR